MHTYMRVSGLPSGAKKKRALPRPVEKSINETAPTFKAGLLAVGLSSSSAPLSACVKSTAGKTTARDLTNCSICLARKHPLQKEGGESCATGLSCLLLHLCRENMGTYVGLLDFEGKPTHKERNISAVFISIRVCHVRILPPGNCCDSIGAKSGASNPARGGTIHVFELKKVL